MNMTHSIFVRLSYLPYEKFRRWFNSHYKLSFNGKYRGLSAICSSLLSVFIMRLASSIARFEKGYPPLLSINGLEIIRFKLGHDKITLYPF